MPREFVSMDSSIDLAAESGRDFVLELVTRGERDLPALWLNPQIYVPQKEPRSAILISLDTLRADHLGCYGYGRPTSPAIDRLAAESVLFENTYASSPWTLPSHASLLTGLDCLDHRVTQASDRMDPELQTLADRFREEGFLTSAFTGGGFINAYYGFSKSFDTFRSREAGEDPGRDAAQLAERAIRWLEHNRGKDFFLFLHTYQMHDPYVPPERYAAVFLEPGASLDRVDMARLGFNSNKRYMPPESEDFRRNVIALYDAEIRCADEAFIEPLVEALKKLGLYDRTMIVLASDHGEEFFEHGSWLHQDDVYDSSLKVPLLIKYPGSRDAGKRVERYARITDIAPTILEEMGLDPFSGRLDGASLRPLVRGSERGEERMFRGELDAYVVDNHVPRKNAVNLGAYKIILNDTFTPADLAFFTVPPARQERIEVYDLRADPGETLNLASTQPDLARRLMRHLEASLKPVREGGRPRDRTTEMRKDVKEELKALGYIR